MMIVLVCCLMLVGCGNKSKEELADIEQFKCQDSIQTVFDVLGKTKIESGTFGGQYYIYEDLNLFGYNGKAVFSVRGDKDTIEDFYCNLTLSDKEFEDILSQFSDKYGSYEAKKHEYENLEIITYEWKFDGEKAEESGYSNISIQYNGDEKYTIYFSDEWSAKDDESYYEYLKEKEGEPESENAEEKRKTLADKSYNYDDGSEMRILFSVDENREYYFSIILHIEEKWKAAHVFSILDQVIQTDEMKAINASIMLDCGDDLLSSYGLSWSSSGDLINTSEWLVDGLTDEKMDTEKAEELTELITKDIVDFIESE